MYDDGLLYRYEVPSDNSCLFSAIAFCFSSSESLDVGYLRQLIAGIVSSDREKYNDAFLGRSNDDYCKWILNPDSWGGGIEVAILSQFYAHEIIVVNIQSESLSRFGEDQNYPNRILLLYDGIHYDALYFESYTVPTKQTVFPTNHDTILSLALTLAKEAKQAHQYTDLSNFQLKCNVCSTLLKGQADAQAHAKKTGHVDFSETK